MTIGVIFAVLTSVFFAFYVIPRKFTKQNPVLYMAYVGLACFVGLTIFYFAVNGSSIGFNETLWSPWHLLSALQGVIWFAGGVFLNVAIDKIGLSKSNQWKNLQGPIGAILMLTILNEISTTHVLYLVLGIVAVFISASFFTIKKENESAKNIKSGVWFAILAAVMFGVSALISKFLNNLGFIFSKNVWFALFVLVSAIVFYLIKYKKPKELFSFHKKTWLPILAGTVFAVAQILNVLAYNYLPGSVAFSIVQLNGVWTILIGIFIFKEINFKQHWLRISLGFAFAVGAIALLVFAL